ncbi:uncharacterized protein KY384_008920 [Bacidia gigantensis]|uniref:uncharacterized protein n=1 Tax=Bacidia gigantensis TaxID=2732470 RepID=UPI001D059164|nr:uncharacterized protein KY384_008920 [Bacidia gigantensis]KAG8525276.1 hypothetical protein KY384_008920 [Bacidia gigantensis]
MAAIPTDPSAPMSSPAPNLDYNGANAGSLPRNHYHPPEYAPHPYQEALGTGPRSYDSPYLSYQTHVELVVRNAILEKEVETCKFQKGEVEIALLRLARLVASDSERVPSHGFKDRYNTDSQAQLTQSSKNMEVLQGQLMQANALISTLNQTIVALTKQPVKQPVNVKRRSRTHEDSDTDSSTSDQESDSEEKDYVSMQKAGLPTVSTSFTSTGTNSTQSTNTYIRRFVKAKESSDSGYERSGGESATSSDSPNLASSFSSNLSGKDISQSSIGQTPSRKVCVHDPSIETKAFNGDKLDNGIYSGAIASVKTEMQSLGSMPAKLTSTNAYVPSLHIDINWAVSRDWGSPLEQKNASQINAVNAGPSDLRSPDLFRYGLRFFPRDHQNNAYRAVIISNIPLSISMRKLLEKVRGGKILDVKLLNTVSITNSKTALVTFLKEHEAIAYVNFVKRYLIEFEGQIAHVKLIPTPTFPISSQINQFVTKSEASRCLEVHDFSQSIGPSEVVELLAVTLTMKYTGLEDMSYQNGILRLRFSAMKYAKHGYGVFCNGRFGACTVHWTPDPCDQRLDTLLEPEPEPGPKPEPKPSMEIQEAYMNDPFTVADVKFSVSKLLCLQGSAEDIEAPDQEASHTGGKATIQYPVSKLLTLREFEAEDTAARLEKIDDEVSALVRKGRGFQSDNLTIKADSPLAPHLRLK